MAGAIELIVGGYVRLDDRKALDDLLMHRRKIVADLNAQHAGIDCSRTIQQIEEDVVVIEAGVARLDGATTG